MTGGGYFGIAASHFLYNLFPLPPGYAESGPSLDELKARIGPQAKRAEGIGLGVGVALALVWCLLVQLLRTAVYSRFPLTAPFVLKPNSAGWWLAMGFGGLLALLVGIMFTQRRLLAGDYPEYVRLSRLQAGCRIDQASRALIAFMALPVLLLTAFVADNYTIFDQDGVTLNPFFSFGATRHPYSDVERIVTAPQLVAPNGNRVNRRVYVIHFLGGDTWNSDSEQRQTEIAQFVSKQSGVPITEVPLFQKGDM